MVKDSLIRRWINDFKFRTILSSILSFGITVLFAGFNGFIGVKYGAVWNKCICLYYCLLAMLRGLITSGALRYDESDIANRNRIQMIASVLLVFLNFSLLIPIILMVLNRKNVNMTMLPAISMAVYTIYKVVMASINLRKARHTGDHLVELLRNINFIDAVISILTIQNTLLVVKSPADRKDMTILAAISSAVGISVIILITVRNIVKGRKKSAISRI